MSPLVYFILLLRTWLGMGAADLPPSFLTRLDADPDAAALQRTRHSVATAGFGVASFGGGHLLASVHRLYRCAPLWRSASSVQVGRPLSLRGTHVRTHSPLVVTSSPCALQSGSVFDARSNTPRLRILSSALPCGASPAFAEGTTRLHRFLTCHSRGAAPLPGAPTRRNGCVFFTDFCFSM